MNGISVMLTMLLKHLIIRSIYLHKVFGKLSKSNVFRNHLNKEIHWINESLNLSMQERLLTDLQSGY